VSLILDSIDDCFTKLASFVTLLYARALV